MSKIVDIAIAEAHLSRLLDRVAAGEEITIIRAGHPVARLVALDEPTPARRIPGAWQGRVTMASDFDPLPADTEATFRGERP